MVNPRQPSPPRRRRHPSNVPDLPMPMVPRGLDTDTRERLQRFWRENAVDPETGFMRSPVERRDAFLVFYDSITRQRDQDAAILAREQLLSQNQNQSQNQYQNQSSLEDILFQQFGPRRGGKDRKRYSSKKTKNTRRRRNNKSKRNKK